jgi:DnaJ-class molecular chaperone
MAEDPYKTLGVSRDASQDDIRRAYHKAAKKHHPDLNPGNAKAEERFKAASAANALLSDAEKRGQFDRGEIDAAGTEQARQPSYRDYADGDAGRRYGQSGPQSSAWSSEDLGNIFGSMFNGGGRPGGRAPLRGSDERYSFTTDFLDAVNGATRRLTLPDGRTLDVKIPMGTSDGQVLRLRGQGGGAGKGGVDGDALVEIHVRPHRHFKRDGQNIRLELPVSLSEAVLGGSIAVPTPGGSVRMQIPAGSDSGTRLRLRGRGVPMHGDHPAGDLYATLRVFLGKPDAALEAFLRDWNPEHPNDPRRDMEASQ